MIPRTIPAVYNSNNDTSIESDALEIMCGISRNQSGEYGIEVDAEFATIRSIDQKFMEFIGKQPFLQLKRPSDLRRETVSDSPRPQPPYT